jgi:hypothetical protein
MAPWDAETITPLKFGVTVVGVTQALDPTSSSYKAAGPWISGLA